MLTKAFLKGIIWALRKERNKRFYKDKKKNTWSVIDSILCEVDSWVLVRKEFKGCLFE